MRQKSSGEWSTGTTIAGYTVLKVIGAGGMGRVYHARDAAGREVAIKTILAADPELVLRFQREAETLAKVDAQAGVVRVHTAGTHAGLPYLVMDYLPGGSLAERLADGPLAPEEAAWVVRELARGLARVHAHGVLHRDLKPQNVLFDEASDPFLADFGLARAQDDDQGLTRSGAMVGTIGYMAPEQALGRLDQVDRRTDVYGLGAILFHALTGRAPFVGKPHEAVKAVVESPAPSPRALEPGVPAALDAICRQALARQPELRYPSAEALGDALDGYLAGDAESAPGPPLVLILTLVAVALTLALALALALGRRSAPPAPTSPGPTVVAESPSPSPSPSPARTPVDASRYPPQDCLRLARSLLAKPDRDPADLADAEAYLAYAVAEGLEEGVPELGLLQLERDRVALGDETLWGDFERYPRLADEGGEIGNLTRLHARLAWVLALLEGRREQPDDPRRGFSLLEGIARDMQGHVLAGHPLTLDADLLGRVSRDPATLALFLYMLREQASDMIFHSEQMDELGDRADARSEAGEDPGPALRLLERLAEDGQPDPYAWYHLALYYDDHDRDEPRALELYLRLVDLPGVDRLRAKARLEAAEALESGKQGIPRDLERARELLQDPQTLERERDARKTLERIEAKLAERAPGGD